MSSTARHSQFEEALQYGKQGESAVTRWLVHAVGASVLPVYDIQNQEAYKGPRLLTPDRDLILPDMLVFRRGRVDWIEVKHKSVFTWHRLTRTWTTGIDKRHHEHYLEVQRRHGINVWLLFLHDKEDPDPGDVPYCRGEKSPTGLFCCWAGSEPHHSHANWGRTGMVYWEHGRLTRMAALDEVYG